MQQKEVYHIVGTNKEDNIIIQWDKEVSLFFFVYDADYKLSIEVVWENTSVSCAIIVVSSNRISSGVEFAVTLKASHTKADVYALSLLGDKAKAQVNGGVVIDPWLIQVEWYLTEENMLLWNDIKIKTLPMLDVRSNDVKASHWATIDRLDPQKIFYLSAKWLSQEQSKRLMIQSYIQKAMDHASYEQDSFIDEIFEKLSG